MREHLKQIAIVLTLILIAFCGFQDVFAQSVLMPMPVQSFTDANGKPLAGGRVFTCSAGLTCPGNSLASYNSSVVSSETQNPNPVVLNSAGRASIWLLSGTAYKILLQDRNGVTVWTADNVKGLATTASGSPQASTTVDYSATPIFTTLAQTQLFKMTLTGDVTSSTLVMTGMATPALVSFEIIQDGTGNHTFAWPLNTSGAAPIKSAGDAITTTTFFWDGTTAWALNNSAAQLTTANTFTVANTFSAGISVSSSASLPAATTIGGATPVRVIYKNVAAVTQTGDTDPHTIYTYTVPGGTINATGQLRITLIFSPNVSAGGLAITVNYGGTLIAQSASLANSGGSSGIYMVVVGGNGGATNSQSWDLLAAESTSAYKVPAGSSSFPDTGNLNHRTSSIDSTANQNLTVIFQGGAPTDSVTFHRLIVETF